MSQELLYTSAPAGLKSGSRGFSTVLCTAGMASNITTRLETLSGYRHVFAPQDSQASLNPVSWSHLRLTINGQPTSILSRIAAYGVDYSGRTNKLAHHVVPSPAEMAQAGPAWLMLQSSWVRSDWDGSCQTPASGPVLPSGSQPVAICQRWQQTTGDAGWGGVLAETISSPASKPLWIVFSIDQSTLLLALINESIALMPISQRWRATFSTYYTNLPPEIDCKIRCVLVGTEEAKLASARGTVIDLTKNLATAPASAYVETARTGVVIAKSIAPTPASLGGTFSSSTSSPLEVINGDDLWPDELSLQPPAVLGKPPAFAMANKPNLPPQLPSGSLNGGIDERRKRQVGWAIGISALAIILLLSAAIPVILGMKKHADGITELATNGTNADQDTKPTRVVQPERKINFGEDKPATTVNTSDTDPGKSGTAPTQNTNSPNPAPQSEGENTATDPEQKPTDSPVNIKSNSDANNNATSSETNSSLDNATNPPASPIPPNNLSKEDASTAGTTLPTGDAISVPGGIPSDPNLALPQMPTAPNPAPKDPQSENIIDDIAIAFKLNFAELILTKKVEFTFEKNVNSPNFSEFKFERLADSSAQQIPRKLETNGTGNVDDRNDVQVILKSSKKLTFTIKLTNNPALKPVIDNAIDVDKYLDDCISFFKLASESRFFSGLSSKTISKRDALDSPMRLEKLLATTKPTLENRRLEIENTPELTGELAEIDLLLSKVTPLIQDNFSRRLNRIKEKVQKVPALNMGKIDFFTTASGLVTQKRPPELTVQLLFKLEIKE